MVTGGEHEREAADGGRFLPASRLRSQAVAGGRFHEAAGAEHGHTSSGFLYPLAALLAALLLLLTATL